MRVLRIGFIAIVFLFLVFSLVKNSLGFKKSLSFYNAYKKEYETKKRQNIVLKTQNILKTSPREVEKTIRNKLNLLKEGEVSIIIPLPSPTPTITTFPTHTPLTQWKDLFF